MPAFTELKIVGFDADRLPRIRKEPYIDLFYQLSEVAPEEWCEDFVNFGRHVTPMAKVDKDKRIFIGTYVKDMDAIPAHLEQLKQAVRECNSYLIEKIKQREQAASDRKAALQEQGGEQFKLNEIVASLDFDE